MDERERVSGAVLVLVGLVLLAGQLAPGIERYLVLLAGLLLLALYGVTGTAAALVPAGVLTGVGAGILLASVVGPEAAGPLFLACLGGGFALVAFLGLARGPRQHWALVPAGVLLAAAVVTWSGGLGGQVLALLATWWPIGLVALGAWQLAWPRRTAEVPVAAGSSPSEEASSRREEAPAARDETPAARDEA
ncbi:MAG TPA: hypothetical protein VFK38_06980 [Candidatus Limnocylindrales bacterium]|nr:hypothetical protein [Candidatus Limnocylindrales bacterium]